MFDVPSDDEIAKVVVTQETVEAKVLPTIVRRSEETRSARRASAAPDARGAKAPRPTTMGAVSTAYRLRSGDRGPVQQSPVTCGSACLTVARMLVDPAFASWIRTGRPHLPGAPTGDTEGERFAAYERVVQRRTNGSSPRACTSTCRGRALGTPPWGAKRELEFGAARRGRTTPSRCCAPTMPTRYASPSTGSSTWWPRASRGCSTSARPPCPGMSSSSFPVTVTGCSTSTTRAPAASTTSGATRWSNAGWGCPAGTWRGSVSSRWVTGAGPCECRRPISTLPRLRPLCVRVFRRYGDARRGHKGLGVLGFDRDEHCVAADGFRSSGPSARRNSPVIRPAARRSAHPHAPGRDAAGRSASARSPRPACRPWPPTSPCGPPPRLPATAVSTSGITAGRQLQHRGPRRAVDRVLVRPGPDLLGDIGKHRREQPQHDVQRQPQGRASARRALLTARAVGAVLTNSR